MNIKLSVIIPMYNVAQYLEKCIGSVYNQGLNENELEVVIIDDDSQDNSLIIAKKLTEQKRNVKVISQINKGLGGARNTGIDHATGEYLLFLDSDDWYLPNTLENILNIANEKKLDVLEFAAQGISPAGEISYHKSACANEICGGFEYYNTVRYMNSACNKLYNRYFLINNDLYFSERIYIEDFEFNTRVFSKANRVMATDYLVAQFLQSPNSITRNTDDEKKKKMVNDLVIVLKKTKTTYDDFKFSIDQNIHFYFKERLGFIVTTLFFQILKNKMSIKEMRIRKKELIEQDLFYVDHPIFQKNKDWFRKIILKNI
jgi:glycosyltransferase involved in cell wall biosynthesis